MVKSSVTIRDWSHDLPNWWEKRLKLNFNIDWCAFSYRYNLFKKLVNFAPLLYLLHLLLVVWHMTVWHSGEENGFTYWIRLEIETIKFVLNTFWTPHFFLWRWKYCCTKQNCSAKGSFSKNYKISDDFVFTKMDIFKNVQAHQSFIIFSFSYHCTKIMYSSRRLTYPK